MTIVGSIEALGNFVTKSVRLPAGGHPIDTTRERIKPYFPQRTCLKPLSGVFPSGFLVFY